MTLKLFNTYVLVNKGSNSKCKLDLKTNGLKFRPDFFYILLKKNKWWSVKKPKMVIALGEKKRS